MNTSNDLLESDCPYPGLRPFRQDEEEFFFGREDHIEQLLGKLEQNRFVSVVGASGCGKSSLVRAGLLPMLQNGFMAEAGPNWRFATLRPGDAPFEHLAAALLEESALGAERGSDEATAAQLEATLRRGRLGLVSAMRETLLPEGTNLLVLVDQFEEIFRYRQQASVDEAEAFVDLLLAAAKHPRQLNPDDRVPVYVLITMRSDFFGDCTFFMGLPEAINESQFLTPRLSRDECRGAIVGPARLLGGDLEPELVARLLSDRRADFDELPLLQHALMRMWKTAEAQQENTESIVLTIHHLAAAGGLGAALSNHADEALSELDPHQRQIAETMFRSLCEMGAERRVTRRLARICDVAEIAGVTPAEIEPIVEAFRHPDRSFLMPPAGVPLQSDTVLDISHESLIRQWQRLKNWVEIEAKSADTYRRVSETASLWHEGKAGLWGTPDLELAEAWRKKERPSENWTERYGGEFELSTQFLDASVQARERRLVRRRVAITTLVTVIGLATTLWIWSLWKANDRLTTTNSQLISAQSELQTSNAALKSTNNELQVARDTLTSTNQALQAEKENVQAQKAEVENQMKSQGYNTQLVFAQQALGERKDFSLALKYLEPLESKDQPGSSGFIWRLYRNLADAPVESFEAHRSEVTCVALDHTGEIMYSGDVDGHVLAWDVATGRSQLLYANPNSRTLSLAISRDGRVMAASFDNNKIFVGDITTEQNEVRVAKRPMPDLGVVDQPTHARTLCFSPRSSYELAVGDDDGRVCFVDIERGTKTELQGRHTDWISSLRFSPDGRWLASAGYDGTVRVWDWETRRPVMDWQHGISLRALDFSSRSDKLAWADDAGNVVLWGFSRNDADPTMTPSRLRNGGGRIYSLAFAPDPSQIETLVWAGEDGTITSCNVDSGQEIVRLSRHVGAVYQLAFSASGKTLVSAGFDRTIRLWNWNVRDGYPVTKGQSKTGIVEVTSTASLSRDAGYLACVRGDRLDIQQLTIRSDEEVESRQFEFDETYDVNDVGFWPNAGAVIAAGRRRPNDSGFVFIEGLSRSITNENIVDVSVAINAVCSVDGKTFATADRHGKIHLWRLSAGKLAKQPKEASIAVSENGLISVLASTNEVVAVGTNGGNVLIWDWGGEEPPFELSAAGLVSITSLRFSVDGNKLAAGDENGVVGLWRDLANPTLNLLRGHQGEITDLAFDHAGETLLSASLDWTVRAWDAKWGGYRGALSGHSAGVRTLAFRDQDTLITVGEDDQAISWRARSDLRMAVPGTLHGKQNLVRRYDNY